VRGLRRRVESEVSADGGDVDGTGQGRSWVAMA
jgi:hypothetical protein